MKFSIKRFISLMLSVFMLIGCAVSVSAQTYHDVSTSGETNIFMNKVDAEDRVNASGQSVGISGMNGYTFISFQGNTKVTFRINITTRGAYELFLGIANTNTNSSNYAVSIDGADEEIVGAVGGLGWYEPNFNSVMIPILETGNHTITVRSVNASVHFMGIKLGFLATDMETQEVLANEVSFKEHTNVSNGTDSIKVIFSELIDETSVNPDTVSVVCDEDEKTVSAETKVLDKVLTVALKETLTEGNTYKLMINGVCDKYGISTIENEEYSFTTDSSDISNGKIEAEAEITYGDVVVTGKYLSSEDVGISGRNVRLFLSEKSDTPQAEAITETDGTFTMEYTFSEEALSGVYTLIIDGNYVSEPCNIDVMYITVEKEKELLDSIATMTQAEEMEAFLTEYENVIGLNLSEDLADVPNPMPVYEGLLNKTYENADELKNEFYTYVALEKINQATDENIIDNVISSEEDCKLLGLPYDRIMLVSDYKNELLTDILELDSKDDSEALKQAVLPIIEKWAASEYGFSDLSIDETDKTVYQGKGIEINIGFTEEISSLKSATIELTVSDESMIDYMSQTVMEDVEFDIETDENVITISALYEGKTPVEKLGTICLTAPSKVGDYSVGIAGTAEYENEDGILFTTDILEKNIDIIVKKMPTGNSGRVNSSSSGRTPSGSGMSVSEYKEKVEEENKQAEETKYRFNDLSQVSWAEESIYTLVDKGVISKNDEKMFYPMRNVTREEFVKMLVCALNLEDNNAVASFVDVDENAWYYPYAATAQKHGLVFGNDKGEFGAGEYITRQDMSVMVSRALLKLDFTAEYDNEKFSDDNEISVYAKDAVYMMKKLGIINGVGGNMFSPKENATRAMAAKIICGVTVVAKQ